MRFIAIFALIGNSVVLGNAAENLIEQALSYTIPPVSLTTDEKYKQEIDDIEKQAFVDVYKGNYDAAFAKVFEGLQQFPTSFKLQYYFTMLFGDYATLFPPSLRIAMETTSQHIFEKLRSEVVMQPQHVIFRFNNEYCYRFAKYKEQYENGQERVAHYWGTDAWITDRGFSGYYCQGVGAANYAKELLLQGNTELAYNYAQKSLVAWAQYFSYKNDFYNAYVHYALALGILGYKDEMMRALQHSADLIQRDLDYVEFQEVITFIDSLK